VVAVCWWRRLVLGEWGVFVVVVVSEGVMEAAWWQRSVSSGSIDGESR
jgi:hypothetical protein